MVTCRGRNEAHELITTQGIHVYELRKFMRSNAGTCIKPETIVQERPAREARPDHCRRPEHGSRASSRLDAKCSSRSCPWNGYNFEDAIMISEKVVKGRYLHLDSHR
jgi:DNA-directed RNA polymerase subunit beta